jgi:hypothetical protein
MERSWKGWAREVVRVERTKENTRLETETRNGTNVKREMREDAECF